MKNAYEHLAEHYRQAGDLQHVASICSWDEAAVMPEGGGEARGQALATLGVVIHEKLTSKQIGEWLDACSNLELSHWQQANLREIQRDYEARTCLPVDLVNDLSLATSRCEQAWRKHRAANDWDSLRPLLEEVVSLTRRSAAVRSERSGLSLYDSLLDIYEPGMRSEEIDRLFSPLKAFLPDFTTQVIEKQKAVPLLPIGDYFEIEKQRELGLRVMELIGFNFNHGRLDVSHHPFCGGVKEDVRITTRYTTDNFVESLMGVIHETGHAMYEQGRPDGWSGQPVGEARSMGVHESQSLTMEMQVGRSKEFLGYIAPMIREVFDASDTEAWSDDNLRRIYTRVERDLIRVNADETTYPLHVIARYEIEKALIEGEMEVADIPGEWDARMMKYLQRDTTGNYADGCMQDVHWPAGLFGYFPTYTLGAMMAAQLFGAAKRAHPDLLSQIGRGDLSTLVSWLRTNVHEKASSLSVHELLMEATGETLTETHLINHLKTRYLDEQ